MKRLFTILTASVLGILTVLAQNQLHFDKTVYDFGQVLMSDGAVKCSFTGKNNGTEDVVIQSVTTSCGCTSVKWDHNPIKSGMTTLISATYTNDEGPYPFDKTLTIKYVGITKPTILHLRGISVQKKKSNAEIYTEVYGNTIGLEKDSFKCGNLEQGGSRGDQFSIANLSSRNVKVSFDKISDGLSLAVNPSVVPAGQTATVRYTVTAISEKWGSNEYSADLCIDGKSCGKKITVRAFTVENFSSLTKEERVKGSRPVFKESTFSFGHKKQGEKLTATFTCDNKGGNSLLIHKVDTDYEGAVPGTFPVIPAGKSGKFIVLLDTEYLPKGEALVIVTLTTNSPVRPIVNLFLAGIID